MGVDVEGLALGVTEGDAEGSAVGIDDGETLGVVDGDVDGEILGLISKECMRITLLNFKIFEIDVFLSFLFALFLNP